MSITPFNFTVNLCAVEDIRTHLSRCDHQFSPRLSERVDICAYAEKIRDKAFTFEAWERENLVGLVAAYMNRAEGSCYITSVSVQAEFSGRGIAAKLIDACLEQADSASIATISLEVSEENRPAISLYEKFGFQITEKRDGALFMMCKRDHSAESSGKNEADL